MRQDVEPHLQCHTLMPTQTLLASVWLLSNQESFRGVADRFGLSKGSLHMALIEACYVLCDRMPNFIRWPNAAEASATAARIHQSFGLTGVVGIMDGTHLPIRCPSANRSPYINRKGFPSLQGQIVWDDRLKILDFFCAYPGSVHDASVLRNSPIKPILDTHTPPNQHVLADSAYQLTNAVLVPFRDNGQLSPVQTHFNRVHSNGVGIWII